MFKLSRGYLLTGIITGLIVLFSFLGSLPDGRLHLVFCNVGQGDAAYIRFPDGRDLLIDGGPNNQVLQCLGKHQPFWDRKIDIVVLSHPQADHLNGLLTVLERYQIGYFVRSDIENDTEGFRKLKNLLAQKKIAEKLVTTGESISIGTVKLAVLWPSAEQLALLRPGPVSQGQAFSDSNILGVGSSANVNDASVVIRLRYGSFDALFPGDADNHINQGFIGSPLADDKLEVLKVPHHGSKTGMSQEFLNWLYPQAQQRNCSSNNLTIQQNGNSCSLAVISVGKNSYGHPAPETLAGLKDKDIKILRADELGDIEVVSDGQSYRW